MIIYFVCGALGVVATLWNLWTEYDGFEDMPWALLVVVLVMIFGFGPMGLLGSLAWVFVFRVLRQ